MEFISVEVSTGLHSHETWGTVVSEIEEHLGVLIGLQNWSTSSLGISLENSNDVLGSNIFALVVDLAAIIDIGAWSSLLGWLVEDLALEWVSGVVGNIIVSEVDDLVLRDTVGLKDLVSMAGISLVSVVAVGVGAGNENSPVVRGLGRHAGEGDE